MPAAFLGSEKTHILPCGFSVHLAALHGVSDVSKVPVSGKSHPGGDLESWWDSEK